MTDFEKQRLLLALADPRFDIPRSVRRAIDVVTSRGPQVTIYVCLWAAAGAAAVVGLSPDDLADVLRGINAKVGNNRNESGLILHG